VPERRQRIHFRRPPRRHETGQQRHRRQQQCNDREGRGVGRAPCRECEENGFSRRNSDVRADAAQGGDGVLQPLPLQLQQKIFGVDRRAFSSRPHFPNNGDNRGLIGLQQFGRESVRVYGAQVPGGERLDGKILQVDCHNQIGFGFDGCRQHVAVEPILDAARSARIADQVRTLRAVPDVAAGLRHLQRNSTLPQKDAAQVPAARQPVHRPIHVRPECPVSADGQFVRAGDGWSGDSIVTSMIKCAPVRPPTNPALRSRRRTSRPPVHL
jgi:hypothetical protein